MKLILFTHYSQFKTASMPRFARMIADGMRERGHEVEEWPCPVILGNKVKHPFLAKWLGYIDQFLLFPQLVRKRLKSEPQDTLFVITDQALGPWVPLIADRQHVIHCHDFLAQRSALGEFPENPTGRTGRLYQAYIRRGYRKGRNFISVSKKTQEDLHRFLTTKPAMSEVVYNGLNYPFCPLPVDEARARLAGIPAFQEILSHVGGQKSGVGGQGAAVGDQKSEVGAQRSEVGDQGAERQQTNNRSTAATHSTHKSAPQFILHVGGNQWYKNRTGVVLIYRDYCKQTSDPIPLLMIGRRPPEQLTLLRKNLENGGHVVFGEDLTDAQVHGAYAAASVFLFPSLEEGFGWPIAEAMACGCPVITTLSRPMTEVGAEASIYIPRMPDAKVDATFWAKTCGDVLQDTLIMAPAERDVRIEAGYMNIRRFETAATIDQYEAIYVRALAQAHKSH